MKSAFFIVASLAAADSPQQFDLLCKGTQETIIAGDITTKPYESRYRLDLNEGKWCVGQCEQGLSNFPEVTDRLIYFERVESNAGRRPRDVSNFVNRQTGKHSALATDGSAGISWQGSCERQPFTGFPQLKKKF